MKTGSPKMKNMIVSRGIDGSHAAEMLKDAWRAFRSLLKVAASPNLMKMDVLEKLKDIHHLLRRKKRRSYDDDAINILMHHSTFTVFTFDPLSHPVHDAASDHNNLSLVSETISDGGGASGCSVNNTAVSAEEVDELADAFISRFYNNVRLEKQRSYRSYQEMLARGT